MDYIKCYVIDNARLCDRKACAIVFKGSESDCFKYVARELGTEDFKLGDGERFMILR